MSLTYGYDPEDGDKMLLFGEYLVVKYHLLFLDSRLPSISYHSTGMMNCVIVHLTIT